MLSGLLYLTIIISFIFLSIDYGFLKTFLIYLISSIFLSMNIIPNTLIELFYWIMMISSIIYNVYYLLNKIYLLFKWIIDKTNKLFLSQNHENNNFSDNYNSYEYGHSSNYEHYNDYVHKIKKLEVLSGQFDKIFNDLKSNGKNSNSGISNEEFITTETDKLLVIQSLFQKKSFNDYLDKIKEFNNRHSSKDLIISKYELKKLRNTYNEFKFQINNVIKGNESEKRFCDKFNSKTKFPLGMVNVIKNVKLPYYGKYDDGHDKQNQIDALIITTKGIFVIEIKNYNTKNNDFIISKNGNVYQDHNLRFDNNEYRSDIVSQLYDHEGAISNIISDLNESYTFPKLDIHLISICANEDVLDENIYSNLGNNSKKIFSYGKTPKNYDEYLKHKRYIETNAHYSSRYENFINHVPNVNAYSISDFIKHFNDFFANSKMIISKEQSLMISEKINNVTNSMPERKQHHITMNLDEIHFLVDYLKILDSL